MRVNVKRVALGAVASVLLWLTLGLLSVVEVPQLARRAERPDRLLEKRIELLESSMINELADSTRLLQQLQGKLVKKEVWVEADPVLNELDAVMERPVLPVLVVACNRVTVRRCLEKLVRYRPNAETFPIIVSQDCNHTATAEVIREFTGGGSGVTHVQQPDQTEIALPRAKLKFAGYYRIARHYRFALGHVLDTLGHRSVIIVEDDLDISEDFYEYFLGTHYLLDKDPTLWCISAWNDNGKAGLIDTSHPELLHRTDFFPGLGWLLPARVWEELKPKWPQAFFDDWLREPAQARGRACIRPEISRTSTFGKEGVSKGMFFDLHLRYIRLNDRFVQFTNLELSYLLKSNYDQRLAQHVAAATAESLERVVAGDGGGDTPVRLDYGGVAELKKILHALGLMEDFRSGVPRTAYLGIVSCFFKRRRVYIVPATPFIKYDPSWS